MNKLLCWMHGKFRHSGAGDPFEDFMPGNCISGGLSRDVDSHQKQYYYSKQLKPRSRQIPNQWFCSEDHEDDDDQLFHGLLTIGTLGLPTTGDHPHETVTPNFGLPPAAATVPAVDSIAKGDHTEATELDLMVISSELEKVLVVPDDNRLSSARASHVSAKQLVVSSCPLQEYLLGSPVGMGERQRKVERGSRRHRKSLAELFMKSNLTVEGGGDGRRSAGGGNKEKAASGMQMMMEKMLKRRGSSHLPSSTAFGVGGDHELDRHERGSNNKFQKIFHQKVHPETSVTGKKPRKAASKSKRGCRRGGGSGAGASFLVSACATGKIPRKESVATTHGLGRCYRSTSPGTDPAVTVSSESGGNREQWIKTDAEYVVLEL